MKRLLLLCCLFSTFFAVAQTPCENGFVNEYPCDNVDMWSFMSIDDLGGAPNLNDIWGWTDIASGREFALVGKANGVSFVDITDPEHPVYMGDLPTHNTNSLWRDVKVIGDYAYIGAEANMHGMQVFDLTQLLTATDFPITFEETAHYAGFGKSHNIIANEESNYVIGVGTSTFEGGLHIVDVSDPLNPVLVGAFGEDGYTHDAQAVNYHGPDKDYCGAEIVFACNEDAITIVDVTVKDDCQLIASQGYAESGYTHQGWLTEDHQYFLANDELDEINGDAEMTRTFVWDVRDLDAPELIGIYEGNSTSIDHNLYTRWDMVFASNYRSGLRVLDASRASQGVMVEKAYFDVQPDDDDVSFSGTWSNYCYFPSGVVVVTDMYSGLFVLQPYVVTATYDQTIRDDEDSATYQVAISYQSESVEIITTDVPVEVTATVGEVNTFGATTIELTGAEALDPGAYPFSISAVVDNVQHLFTAVLNVTEETAPEISLVSPLDENLEDANVTFTWTDNIESDVILEIATDDAFSDVVYSELHSGETVDLPVSLPDGTYFWRVMSQGVCGESTESESGTFTVTTVSVEENVAFDLEVYPNPANEQVNVTLSNELVGAQLELFNALGQCVWSVQVADAGVQTYFIGRQAKGVYTLKVKGATASRLVIQ